MINVPLEFPVLSSEGETVVLCFSRALLIIIRRRDCQGVCFSWVPFDVLLEGETAVLCFSRSLLISIRRRDCKCVCFSWVPSDVLSEGETAGLMLLTSPTDYYQEERLQVWVLLTSSFRCIIRRWDGGFDASHEPFRIDRIVFVCLTFLSSSCPIYWKERLPHMDTF
jgi:hypothetical protein